MRSILMWCAPLALCAAACSDDDNSCDLAAQSGCDEGLVCEAVTDGAPACFAPVVLHGDVFDLGDDAAVAGARVVALDVNRAALSSVAVTAVDGTYALPVPSTRNADGTPVAVELTLRVDAAGYQAFPAGIRQALPIDTAAAVAGDDGWTVASTLTSV